MKNREITQGNIGIRGCRQCPGDGGIVGIGKGHRNGVGNRGVIAEAGQVEGVAGSHLNGHLGGVTATIPRTIREDVVIGAVVIGKRIPVRAGKGKPHGADRFVVDSAAAVQVSVIKRDDRQQFVIVTESQRIRLNPIGADALFQRPVPALCRAAGQIAGCRYIRTGGAGDSIGKTLALAGRHRTTVKQNVAMLGQRGAERAQIALTRRHVSRIQRQIPQIKATFRTVTDDMNDVIAAVRLRPCRHLGQAVFAVIQQYHVYPGRHLLDQCLVIRHRGIDENHLFVRLYRIARHRHRRAIGSRVFGGGIFGGSVFGGSIFGSSIFGAAILTG